MLRKALKTDYENNGEKFPEPMKVPKKRGKKKKKLKAKMSESIAEKLEVRNTFKIKSVWVFLFRSKTQK